jgi:hypothetical protein
MSTAPNALIITCFVIEAIFWLGAYFLILKHAFQEKTYGMPIVAMVGNISWELLYGTNIFASCPATWAGCPNFLMEGANFMAFFMDAIILYTILRFGRDKFKQPAIRQYFYGIVLVGIAVALPLIYAMETRLFITNPGIPNQPGWLSMGDFGGVYTGFGLGLDMGILFIAMFYARKGLEGQSFYIALFMALGNLMAFFFNYFAGTVDLLVMVLFISGAFFNFVYVYLTYRRAQEMGLNPWKNF